ncbi:MAG: 3-deoxy-8-phosphooctulonate synthase [Verrucomicrobiota bacterium]
MPKRTSKARTPILVIGPCVLESPALALKIAKRVKALSEELGWPAYFKASYDKANRTSLASGRGPGIEKGLEWLQIVRDQTGLPITSDVHSVEEMSQAGPVLDLIQIPAFLCRQTDLLIAAAKTGKAVSVKKGQFLAPGDVDPLAKKLTASGCKDYFIIERGTTFGYNNLVVDMRSLAMMRAQGHRVIIDGTHSVQRPGGMGGSTGGDGELAPVITRAAVAAGVDGIFLETHPDPLTSPSDGANMIPLKDLPKVLRQLKKIHEAIANEKK